jgi:hypothetical protein
MSRAQSHALELVVVEYPLENKWQISSIETPVFIGHGEMDDKVR